MEEEKNSPPEYINQVQFTVQVHVADTKWVQNFYEVAFKLFLSGGSTIATVIYATY